MRKILSYIFTVPACILFLIAELVAGETLAWRYKEVMEQTWNKCSKCGHKGKLKFKK